MHRFYWPKWLFFFFFLICLSKVSQSTPLQPSQESNSNKNHDMEKAKKFMVRFGYLPHGQENALMTEQHIEAAIKQMQKFGGVPITGSLDEQTKKLFDQSRCGLPDVRPESIKQKSLSQQKLERQKRYALSGQKWDHLNVSWSLRNWPPNLDRNRCERSIKAAFHLWTQVSLLHFHQVSGTADIEITFMNRAHGDMFPFDGQGRVLAHAFFPGTDIGGDVHLDAAEHWLSIDQKPDQHPETSVMLYEVVVHELGHSLGLSHSSTPGSLMFPYYQKLTSEYRMHYDDTQAIQMLYGSPDDWKPDVNENYLSNQKPSPSAGSAQKPNKTLVLETGLPNICNGTFDAIITIRRETFFFKNKHFWRQNVRRQLDRVYPVEIRNFFDFPSTVTKVDGGFERPSDRKVMFFVGKLYYLFRGNRLETGYPRRLTDLGLPDNLERIDSAMIWGHNGKAYLFASDLYWRLDNKFNQVQEDYPRVLSVWKGVPMNMDAALLWSGNGVNYFFKDQLFYTLNNEKMEIIQKSEPISDIWFPNVCNR